ncbi:MAG TPA: HNH endonuclease [Blastocatellia bacterium]|nr:HNH endonuclease [Blastocatellia bacterium]
MAYRAVPRTVRQIIRDRADNRCEYCRRHAAYACAPFVCEHILPRVRGAGNTISELAWACAACNGHKYAKTHARDPKTGRTVALFHPRR